MKPHTLEAKSTASSYVPVEVLNLCSASMQLLKLQNTTARIIFLSAVHGSFIHLSLFIMLIQPVNLCSLLIIIHEQNL